MTVVQISPARGFDYERLISRTPFASMPNAKEVLNICMRMSRYCWIGRADEVVACVYGVIAPSLLSDRAYLWLLHSDLVEEHKFLFVRHSQIVVKELLKEFKSIHGHCVIGEDRSVRWLRWLGAVFGEPDGNKIPFEIRTR